MSKSKSSSQEGEGESNRTDIPRVSQQTGGSKKPSKKPPRTKAGKNGKPMRDKIANRPQPEQVQPVSRSRKSKNESVQRLKVRISIKNVEFEFELCHRPLNFGLDQPVRYYWMDTSQLRNPTTSGAQDAIRDIISYWASSIHQAGYWDDLHEKELFLSATCYQLMTSSKGMQDCFRDSFLKEGRTKPKELSISEASRKQIVRMVRERDINIFRKEMNSILRDDVLPERLLPLYQMAYQNWIGKGISVLQDPNLFEKYLEEIDMWMHRFRKKSGNQHVRRFLNMFAYETKMSFYTCYTAVWMAIITTLKQIHSLDPISERFLRFWHAQDRTDGESNEELVFGGQIYALHPLSGFCMKDDHFMTVAGRFFGTPAHECIQQSTTDCQEYWDLMGSILSAAHLYRVGWDVQRNSRSKPQTSEVNEKQEIGEAMQHILEMAIEKTSCSKCKRELELVPDPPKQIDDESFEIRLHCAHCNRFTTKTYRKSDFYTHE